MSQHPIEHHSPQTGGWLLIASFKDMTECQLLLFDPRDERERMVFAVSLMRDLSTYCFRLPSHMLNQRPLISHRSLLAKESNLYNADSVFLLDDKPRARSERVGDGGVSLLCKKVIIRLEMSEEEEEKLEEVRVVIRCGEEEDSRGRGRTSEKTVVAHSLASPPPRQSNKQDKQILSLGQSGSFIPQCRP